MTSVEIVQPSSVIQHTSLPEKVHRVLWQRILNNELPAGAQLAEAQLAAEFGVSRTTIRSALRELHAERLIDVSPRRGSTVSRMSDQQIHEVCHARFVLESACYREVLPDGRALLTERMQTALRTMTAAAGADDPAGVILADTELHRAVVEAAAHPVLLDLWQSLNSQMAALMRSDLDRQGIGLDETAARHARLLSAIRDCPADGVIAALEVHYLDAANS